MPDLWLTTSKYLASLRAVLAPTGSSNAEAGKHERAFKLTSEQIEANRIQFERTDELVKQFMLNEGPQLQRDLKEHANKCQNWVSSFEFEFQRLAKRSTRCLLAANPNVGRASGKHFESHKEQLVVNQALIASASSNNNNNNSKTGRLIQVFGWFNLFRAKARRPLPARGARKTELASGLIDWPLAR